MDNLSLSEKIASIDVIAPSMKREIGHKFKQWKFAIDKSSVNSQKIDLYKQFCRSMDLLMLSNRCFEKFYEFSLKRTQP